ncbi:MAG: Fic family protein [Planctomycetota bacterium]
MPRIAGTYYETKTAGDNIRAFIPRALPPKEPPLLIEGNLSKIYTEAMAAIGRLEVAGALVPNPNWFLYGFVRKEAVVSSQIEGTQATLEDVVVFETTRQSERTADVEEICNYIDAMTHARREIARPKGLPLCSRLLCAVHKRLMKGVRGGDKQPGIVRTSQNWIGGTRPGNARFVPPSPEFVPEALAQLDKWIHGDDSLPALVRAGLAHVQFETIHPFLDGNGRVGRLLITLLLEHWKLLSSPLLYVSLGFKRHRQEYYERLNAVRTHGDWEGWTSFFLECVRESADDGVASARSIFSLVGADRRKVGGHKKATVTALRLFEFLPSHPIVTLTATMDLLKTTQPTAGKALDALCQAGVLCEITGKRRDRVYAYRAYLDLLSKDTEVLRS